MAFETPNSQRSIEKTSSKTGVIALDSGAGVHLINECEIREDAQLQEEYTSIQTAMSGAHLNSRYTTDVGHMERVRIIEDDSLDTNLASVAKFDQAGCEVTFKHGWGTVTDA